MYNKKDIIRINQEIGESGALQNESSLDFALHIVKHKKSWLYELAYIIRSLLIDHAFQDGNKRTAYTLCVLYFEDFDLEFSRPKTVDAIRKIAKQPKSDINKIARELRRCLT